MLEEVVDNYDKIDDIETSWISKYKSVEGGYNIRSGGSRGKFSAESREKMSKVKRPPHSDETKKKISIGNRGKILSPESIARQAAKMRGRKATAATKVKMSLAKLGRKIGPHSEEHKKKISESCKASQWGWERGRRKKE